MVAHILMGLMEMFQVMADIETRHEMGCHVELDKGRRVLTSSFRNVGAVSALWLIEMSYSHTKQKDLSHLE